MAVRAKRTEISDSGVPFNLFDGTDTPIKNVSNVMCSYRYINTMPSSTKYYIRARTDIIKLNMLSNTNVTTCWNRYIKKVSNTNLNYVLEHTTPRYVCYKLVHYYNDVLSVCCA